jgi:hypothetical protein
MSDTSSVEDARIEIEREKLAIERKKLDLEIAKAKWTSISIAVPVVVVFLSVAFGMYGNKMQAAQSFRLEAVKAVVTAETEAELVTRATFLREQFPEELGPGFLRNLRLSDFDDAPNVLAKFRFIRFVAPQGLNAHETAQLYHYLFPRDDRWWRSEEVKELLLKATDRPRK